MLDIFFFFWKFMTDQCLQLNCMRHAFAARKSIGVWLVSNWASEWAVSVSVHACAELAVECMFYCFDSDYFWQELKCVLFWQLITVIDNVEVCSAVECLVSRQVSVRPSDSCTSYILMYIHICMSLTIGLW